MGKKIWYSTPLKTFWNDLYRVQKKYTPEFTDEQIFMILKQNLLTAPLHPDESPVTRELMVSGLELWREDMRGELLHIYFLDKELRDFLGKTPLTDLEGIRQYFYENGKRNEIAYIGTKSKVNCVVYNYGLHIPYENEGYAFSLILYEDNTIELYFSRGDNNGRISDKFYKELNSKKDNESIEICKFFRIAINTIAYMKCFPECVAEGVPKITKPSGEDRSEKNIIFQMSNKIIDSDISQTSKIPHFRKGYFRLLQSDYFTHKKGEMIFIKETMVKGKAKTVSTSEKIEEFESKTKSKK